MCRLNGGTIPGRRRVFWPHLGDKTHTDREDRRETKRRGKKGGDDADPDRSKELSRRRELKTHTSHGASTMLVYY